MKTPALLLTVLASAVLAGCANNAAPVRVEPTYQEAASNQFIQSSRDAVAKLTTGFDMNSLGGGPVLVATVVNVNDLSRAAPLGRTLSEQYATSMAASGFNVKEIKLRGDVFVREGQGELLLSREVREVSQAQNAQAVVVGTYAVSASVVYISLKLVNPVGNQVIAAHNYAVPADENVRTLLAGR